MFCKHYGRNVIKAIICIAYTGLRISAVLDVHFALFPNLWLEVCLFSPQPVAQL